MVIVDGIDTIDATHVSTGLGHSVFGDVRSVIEDISLLLRLGLPPTRRKSSSRAARQRRLLGISAVMR